MKKLVIVSGYFNPLHKGHLELFHKAKSYGDELFVIINYFLYYVKIDNYINN